ncbi:hypothetical protein CMO86_07265 [Candidatus Woesearchaeota archaeon]|nr:hypothetical protein [Candidatus Woesearchaeota archaeon]
MSVQIATKGSEPANITKLTVNSNQGGKAVDLRGGFVQLTYTESIMSDSVIANYTFIDSGASIDGKSVRDGLPLVGEERVELAFEDNAENKLEVTLYVNKVTPIENKTQKSILSISLVSKEFIMNEKTRAKARYDGKISDTIKKIVEETLESDKTVEIEPTVNEISYIPGIKKPFYTINTLCKKAVSSESQTLGSTAGYFFYETSEGFFFKSIDGLLDQEPKAKTIYNESPDTAGGNMPEGKDFKALKYNKKDNVNVQEKMKMGALTTRQVIFDPFTCYYEVINPRTDDTEGDLKNAGRDGLALSSTLRNKEFDRAGKNEDYTRTTYRLLDKGTLPTGDTKQQIDKSAEENFKGSDIENQAVMRYNQFFSSQADIVIPGNFALHAGDMIHLDVPGLSDNRTETPDDQDGGLYIITDICHTITAKSTFTRCNLSRDSIGRKPAP